MNRIEPRLPKGSRDFLPAQVSRRNYLIDNIRQVFRTFGFQEIQTPAMEQLSTLTGKYGEEGDKLLFKILNSGNYLRGIEPDILAAADERSITGKISDKGLRYDLTVPLARYVVQHRNELVFPFRRSQIGPVWRADRPQKGRYREFYQCDADIIGSSSLQHEIELTQVLAGVFEALKLKVLIQINHRAILEGIVRLIGAADLYAKVLVAIDKLEKAGREKVAQELGSAGIGAAQTDRLFELLAIQDLAAMRGEFAKAGLSTEGIDALDHIMDRLPTDQVDFCPQLARGLDYYTGTIWEVKAENGEMGSIAAGGRYDDLTEMFGGTDMSGVGISFGIERIYDLLESAGNFPEGLEHSTRVLIINFGGKSEQAGWNMLNNLRRERIPSEMYPEAVKLKKQMAYADKKNIPFVIFLGEEEISGGRAMLKDMASGTQEALAIAEVIDKLS